MEIVNRALRFARQQDAALKKKGISENQEDRCYMLNTNLMSLLCSKLKISNNHLRDERLLV